MRAILRAVGALFLVLGSGLADVAGAQDETAAQRLFFEGQRRAEQGNVEGALDEYDTLVSQFPGSALAPAALLESARLLEAVDTDRALAKAEELIDGYGRSPEAAAAFVLKGRTLAERAVSLTEIEEARTAFQRVPLLFGRESYPRLDARSEARVRTGQMSLLLGEDEEAAAAFLEAIEDEPPSLWTSRGTLGFAAVLLFNGDWKPAAEVLQQAIDVGTSGREGEGEVVAAARRRLTLIHRLYLRPQASQPVWSRARALPTTGMALKRPVGVAAREDGTLIISDGGAPLVVVLSPELQIESRASYKNPGRPWFGADGVARVTMQDAVQSPGPRAERTTFTTRGEKPKPLNKLESGQLGIFREWLIIDRELGKVAVFDATPRQLGTMGREDSSGAIDIARDGRGHFYVLDAKSKRVLRFGADRSFLGSFTGTWRRPQALAVDALGHVFVLDSGSRTIDVRTGDGSQITSIGPTLPGGLELRSPEDLAVDGAGRLFVADSKLASIVLLE